MESKSIMQEIKEHLESGKSSGEVIGMGYPPSTVYKVQRQMRQSGQLPMTVQGDGRAPVQDRAMVPVHAQVSSNVPTPTVVQIVQDTEARAKLLMSA